jgi:hypothetical protein
MDDRLFMDQVQTVFNETGADTDFRVESDSNANALFVQASDGKVGIGTSSPETNNAASVGLPYVGGGAAIQLNVNGGGGIFSGTDTINTQLQLPMGHLNGTNRLEMLQSTTTVMLTVLSCPLVALRGGLSLTNAAKLTLWRLQTVINLKYLRLRAVTGRYNYDDANVRRSMLIAQDVQAVLPEAVGAMTASMEDPTEYLTLNYAETIPLLVSALKDAQTAYRSINSPYHGS